MVGPSASILSCDLEIEGEQRGAAADRADLVVDLLQRAGGAADQDQVRAFPGVGQRHGPADAAGGSGDEGEAAGEALWGVHGPRLAWPMQCKLMPSP